MSVVSSDALASSSGCWPEDEEEDEEDEDEEDEDDEAGTGAGELKRTAQIARPCSRSSCRSVSACACAS